LCIAKTFSEAVDMGVQDTHIAMQQIGRLVSHLRRSGYLVQEDGNMLGVLETKAGDAAKVADVKKLVGETAQASAAYGRMLADERATGARATAEKNMDQVNRAGENMFKAAEGAAAFGRGNVEALAKATQAYVSGVQDLNRQTMAMVQGLTDQALEGAKALSGVRSLKEAAEIQANLTRKAFERTINDATKLQETALKVAEQSFAPLSARVTLAVEKMGRPIGA
jgi:phasin family protein